MRGYVEGENVAFEIHYAPGNPLALRQVISELRRGNITLQCPAALQLAL